MRGKHCNIVSVLIFGALVQHLPCTEDSGADNRNNPVHTGVRSPAEPEEANGHQESAGHGRWEAELWRRLDALLAFLFLVLRDEMGMVLEPERLSQDAYNHADAEAAECQPDLIQVEAVVDPEDQWKSAEEEVDDAQQDGGVNA